MENFEEPVKPPQSSAVESTHNGTPRLRVEAVSKVFPGVKALDAVSFEVWPGEVHALVGENGAGKSTLMRLIAGIETPDSGHIYFDGEPLINIDEQLAHSRGIGMVHQERSLVPGLSVAENVFAARQPTNWLGGIDWTTMRKRTRDLLHELQVDIHPDQLVMELSPAQQQMVEIAKGLSLQLRMLILDEPTAALTIAETEHLFEVIRHLTAQNISVIYISHRLGEVFEIAQRITVLKDGKVTGERAVSEVTQAALMQLMVGRELSFIPEERRVSSTAPVVLRVEHLASTPAVVDASLTVREGEIVCLAGLVGAGRTELCETIFGVRPRTYGEVFLNEKKVAFMHPAQARDAGIGMVPEDRKDDGLFLDMNIIENIVAANLHTVSQRGVVSARKSRELAQSYVNSLRIATPGIEQVTVNLSGGNQQKVLLAKWFARQPRLLIVDEPTKGVDVGARADIYNVLRGLAQSGVALLVVSSDLLEVLTLAHRIVVMAEGHTVGELDTRDADETTIVTMASSAPTHQEGSVA